MKKKSNKKLNRRKLKKDSAKSKKGGVTVLTWDNMVTVDSQRKPLVVK